MFKKLSLYLAALVATVSIAFAGGAFNGFPIVGDTTGTVTCLSFGNNGVCNQFSPAGPANLVGSATIPADTNVQGAAAPTNPATVNIPAVLTAATSIDAAPLTGTSITMPNGIAKLLLDPAGTIAALTVVTSPATALVDGQELQISSSQTVTALTVTPGTGTTLAATVTTVGASAPVDLVYHAASAKWVSQ
jgi:hypothetical protein